MAFFRNLRRWSSIEADIFKQLTAYVENVPINDCPRAIRSVIAIFSVAGLDRLGKHQIPAEIDLEAPGGMQECFRRLDVTVEKVAQTHDLPSKDKGWVQRQQKKALEYLKGLAQIPFSIDWNEAEITIDGKILCSCGRHFTDGQSVNPYETYDDEGNSKTYYGPEDDSEDEDDEDEDERHPHHFLPEILARHLPPDVRKDFMSLVMGSRPNADMNATALDMYGDMLRGGQSFGIPPPSDTTYPEMIADLDRARALRQQSNAGPTVEVVEESGQPSPSPSPAPAATATAGSGTAEPAPKSPPASATPTTGTARHHSQAISRPAESPTKAPPEELAKRRIVRAGRSPEASPQDKNSAGVPGASSLAAVGGVLTAPDWVKPNQAGGPLVILRVQSVQYSGRRGRLQASASPGTMNDRLPVVVEGKELSIKAENLEFVRLCWTCSSVLLPHARTACGGCLAARYCSPECQLSDWNAGHSNSCNKRIYV